ncbi:glycosyltransferase family 39 protein [Rugosimonospora africana]|uniref:Glycosyl transferase n=1 Tax=Rugosimonospora africana TaxID=556532 RepID=A0A8J3VSJ1_9ACTN|nr:glycosyltransferase family 39 protein [Rugosimonospora africana]GIH17124.1 glycosyl transferase [Rugosimonospora africana]
MSHTTTPTTTPTMETLAPPPASEPGERGVRPRWVRPALLVLLVGTALLYLWGLSASGTANDFYAAAVQSGTKSWKAFLFGSFDSANFITVDKPPASLWIMELSGRIFGFSSWSMLAPQAVEGVAAVGLLYATVRRWFGPVAGLAAGAMLALTPVAVLMFRFNNPDALLTLLMVAGAYATTRAIERARLRWVLLAGATVGFAFLTKTLEAFLVLPAFALAYLVAAPTGLGRRLLHLLAGLGALVASAGWWVLTVQLWPASARPYIGGSTDNSVLGVAFGYNGLGRITGSEGGGPGGGARGPGDGLPGGGETLPGGVPGGLPGRGAGAFPGGGNPGFGGDSGLGRLFGDSMGTQISWLLPAALIGLVAGLWLTRRAPRTDRTRAGLLLSGGWLLVTGLVFSYMRGIIHPYYTVVLAPPIAALVAVGGRELWRHRTGWFGRIGLAAMVATTGLWGQALLGRTPNWYPALRYALIAATVLALLALLVPVPRLRRVAAVGGLAAVLVGVLSTGGYALDTAATPHSGSIPTAGPASVMGGGPGGFGGMPGGDPMGGGPVGEGRVGEGRFGAGPIGAGSGAGPGTPEDGGGFMGAGNPVSASTVDPALAALLRDTTSRWAAATEGSQGASPLELATGKAVMAMGGFSGSDPAPSLAQFRNYVSRGEIHYYIGGGMGGGRGGNQISTWVEEHFTATTVGGTTVYDLTKPTS